MSQQLAHFLRTTATPLAADKWYMLAEYGLEASAVALLSQRWRRGGGKQRELLGEQLKRLGMAISTARILYRLLDTFTMIDWLNGLYAASSPKEEHDGEEVSSAPNGDARLRRLEKAQAWSMMACSPLEAVWYLSSIGTIRMKENLANRIGIWSARCWSLFVVFQILHTLRARHLLAREKQAYLLATAPRITLRQSSVPANTALSGKDEEEKVRSSASSDSGVGLEGDAAVEVAGKLVPGDEAIEEEVADFEGKMDDFRTQERNLGDALGEGLGIFPLTVHWSMGETLFPSGSAYVGVLGSISALFAIRKSWRETA